MATIEVEKLIYQLEPKYLQDLLRYIDYLLFVQEKQANTNGKAEKKPVVESKTEAVQPLEEDVPERLRILRQYMGIAPKPHFPVTKYDVYEQ